MQIGKRVLQTLFETFFGMLLGIESYREKVFVILVDRLILEPLLSGICVTPFSSALLVHEICSVFFARKERQHIFENRLFSNVRVLLVILVVKFIEYVFQSSNKHVRFRLFVYL